MKTLAVFALIALTVPPAIAAGVATPLVPYVGGRVVGREADGQKTYTYAWPGAYFEAAFQGDAVDIKVNDDQNNLDVLIDGTHKLTLTRPGQTTVTLKNLGPGRHAVRLEKTSETQSSTGTFEGFFVSSADRVLPPPHPERAIEFIGDSFTVGYGDLSRGQTCTVEDVRDTTDTAQAFAPLTAKHFAAAYRINAFSGRGIVRNYDNLAYGETLPFLYGYALFDKSAVADDAGWSPDVIVVYLGTNDFSTALKADEPWKSRDDLHADYQQKYVAFVQTLRAKHPSAHIILMATADANSPFAIVGKNELFVEVSAVFDKLTAAGMTDIELLPVAQLDYMACHGHPSLKDHAKISGLLIERISHLSKFSDAPQANGTR